MASTLVPPPELLPQVLPTGRLNERGVPTRELRAELRQIPTARNALTVVLAIGQTFGVVGLAGYLNTWWAYALAFVYMTRGHGCLNILAHESAHRLLFPNQSINDFVGRWVVGYPSLNAFGGYRRVHFAHHRDELGPNEPDLALYSGYPIPRDSWHRKLRRDALGQSAYKNLRGLALGVRAKNSEALQIAAYQVVLLGSSVAVQRPLMYVVWLLSWSTTWKVSNRLRAIAEHGGMVRSKDRRLTTHVIRQTRPARFWIAPYNTGYHLAHHVDMGVPFRNLPRLHHELISSGWIAPETVYPNYRSFWRACSSGTTSVKIDGAGAGTSSFLSFD